MATRASSPHFHHHDMNLPAPFALGLQPPYYAVIFSSQRTDGGAADYDRAADRMATLAAEQPGYLGIESTRDAQGFGITVSYWRALDDVAAWKRNAEHTLARDTGRAQWYTQYELRVARVERAYAWQRPE
jgi:heme-degrading monooxygenase HmoA